MKALRRAREVLQWFGLLGGAARLGCAARARLRRDARALRLAAGQARPVDRTLGARASRPSRSLLALAAAGGRGRRAAQRARRDDGRADGRRRFFAAAALLANVLFLLAILLSGITAATEAPTCRQS